MMKRRMYQSGGILIYLGFLGILLEFDWVRILQPLPIVSVLAGMVILTGSQFKRGMSQITLLSLARWNAFTAGLLTTLLSLLSQLTAAPDRSLNSAAMAEKLTPLIYGSIFYLLIGILSGDVSAEPAQNSEESSGVFLPEIAGPILAARGFSPRETHVALKLLEGITNKEIGEQLYISETTVKKHIQNMFRKCGAEDRQDFMRLYLVWYKEPLNPLDKSSEDHT